ncbi:MAG TPA: gamma-glutamyltransferase [Longimicrobiales bacterium]
MVSAAHPLAAEAGVEILRRGGNAVDAAVATAFAIGVVEPMMSGLGGGGGMLIWLQEEGRAEYVDFYSAARATAWRGALPDTGTASLREVGVPGAVAGLLEAHERFGRLSRAEVMAPAIRLAEEGFPVYVVLADAIRANRAKLERFPEAARRFLPNGAPPAVGSTFRQPELAATLQRIAEHGKAGFYEGEVARSVVAVLNAGGNPTTLADFAAYTPRWSKRPVCGTYRRWTLLSAPPPQGGMHIIHALNLLEPHDLARLGLPTRSVDAFDVLASALRVAAADNGRHNGDPNWTAVPAAGLTSKAFARTRAELVGTRRVPDQIPRADATAHDHAPPPASCAPLHPYGPAPAIRTEQEDDDANASAGAAAGFAAIAEIGGVPAASGGVAERRTLVAHGSVAERTTLVVPGRVAGHGTAVARESDAERSTLVVPGRAAKHGASGVPGSVAEHRTLVAGGSVAEHGTTVARGSVAEHRTLVASRSVAGHDALSTSGNVAEHGTRVAPGEHAGAVVVSPETPEGETTHLSVVDRDGNAVALTYTLSPFFGSGAWVEGFFLNSSAVDFSRSDPNAPARSDWRVRTSTISPTIVLEDGRVRMVIGAPGGGRIPGAIIQGLVYMLDYGMDPLEALRMPRIFPSTGNRRVEVEHGYPGAVLGQARALGWEPTLPGDGYARLYVVARVGDVWVGAADPRHDGGARGY